MPRGIVEFNDEVPAEELQKTSLLLNDLSRGFSLQTNAVLDRLPNPRGVFSEFPSITPKWLGRRGGAQPDFRETMARMFILLGEHEKDRYLRSVGKSALDEGESRILAAVLAGTDGDSDGMGYIDFLLQQADHSFQEKSQIVETLADNYVMYYFGAAAVPFSYSGTVFNTFEDDQAINMLRIYRDMIRGTQLARRRKLLRLRYNGMIVAGSVMNLSLGLSADPETTMSFNFQLMPKSIQLLPAPDFGVVVLKEGVGIDTQFYTTTDQPTNITSAKPIGAPAEILKEIDFSQNPKRDFTGPPPEVESGPSPVAAPTPRTSKVAVQRADGTIEFRAPRGKVAVQR